MKHIFKLIERNLETAKELRSKTFEKYDDMVEVEGEWLDNPMDENTVLEEWDNENDELLGEV